MKNPTRAMTTAAELLAKHPQSRVAVNVRNIARQYAHIQTDPLPDDISGMLIPAPHTPKGWIIAVNGAHVVERQRFSLAHELAHLLLHDFRAPHADGTLQVRYRNTESSKGTDRDEIEANQFAAELLLPADLLIPRLEALSLDWQRESPAMRKAVEDLAHEFQVSQQALLLRIGSLLHR